MQGLAELYADTGPERCGFILPGGEIVEVTNVAADPVNAFAVSADDLIKYGDFSEGTFHTHPGTTNNLTGDDYLGFQGWPDHYHIIIGNDGIARYTVNAKGKVLRDEA